MDSVAIWLEDDGGRVENIERRRLRDHSNIMELSHESFVKNFRLSKEAFLYTLEAIEHQLPIPKRQTAVPGMIKLAATLKFLAQGGYQHQIGQDRYANLSQSRLSVCISETCKAIEDVLCPIHISFVLSEENKNQAKQNFYRKSGIPGVIGLIDGTHIQIIRPRLMEHLFFNRKLKHSINAMIISDQNMKILAVNGKYGGASHDSHVWGVSAEKAYLERSFLNGDRSSWLLGDSGYPLEPWLLTPYRVATENSPESKFNERLSAARSLIERTFGVLKGRFRCLLAARELYYSPKKATQIINSCCALHNICLQFKVELPTVEPLTTEDSYRFEESHSFTGNDLQSFAARTRNEIKDSLL